MFKKLFIVFILFCNVSYANILEKYELELQEIPMACGQRDSIDQFLKDYNFQLVNMSIGRAGNSTTGVPVFLAEYFINKSNTETAVILSSPDDMGIACLAYRTFDLKQGKEIEKYLMLKNR